MCTNTYWLAFFTPRYISANFAPSEVYGGIFWRVAYSWTVTPVHLKLTNPLSEIRNYETTDIEIQFLLSIHLVKLSQSCWLVFRRKIFVMRSLNPCPENFDQIVVVSGGGVNYQMQIVNTKLPNENLQTYQLQMISFFWGGGKLPNTNCEHQTTK